MRLAFLLTPWFPLSDVFYGDDQQRETNQIVWAQAISAVGSSGSQAAVSSSVRPLLSNICP